MKLKIKRNQRNGVMGKVIFQLDVMAELTAEERELVKKYKLGKELVYSSDTAEHNAAMVRAGSVRAMGAAIMDRASKRRFTMDELIEGQHLECKDLAELMDTEEQVQVACHTIRQYLDIAKSFDGRELILDIEATDA